MRTSNIKVEFAIPINPNKPDLKLHGRNVSKFYCKKCLMKMHNMTEEDYQNQVNEFKKQGCDLF